jgi:methyl-accepting chemotaxis protein
MMALAMKNPKSKTGPKNAYTPTEVGTLIDGFKSDFKLFGEKLDSMSVKLDATYEQTARNTEKIALLEAAVQSIASDLRILTQRVDELTQRVDKLTQRVDELTQRVDKLTQRVDELTQRVNAIAEKVEKNTEAIAMLAKSIDKLATTKLDREEFHVLESRVNALENKVAALSR